MTPEEIKELMKSQHWEVPEMARAANVREATVYNWLNGGNLSGTAGTLLREWLARSRAGLPLTTPDPGPRAVAAPAELQPVAG